MEGGAEGLVADAEAVAQVGACGRALGEGLDDAGLDGAGCGVVGLLGGTGDLEAGRFGLECKADWGR